MTLNASSLTLAACLVSLLAGSAMADDDERRNPNAFLKGTYRTSGNQSCADVPLGFTDPPDRLANGEGNTPNFYFTGVSIYDGKGTVMTTQRGILIVPGPYIQGSNTVFSFEETCNLTYAVKRDGSFTQEGDCTATDGSVKVTGFKSVGQIGAGGSVLNISSVLPPEVVTLEFFDNHGTLAGSTQRLCGFVGTAVRIHRERIHQE